MSGKRILRRLAAAALAAFALLPLARAADAVDPWAESFARFSAADQATAPAAGGVIFVGSSSIRLWPDFDRAFTSAQVILNRGFGGSQLSDCLAHVDRLVIGYRPRLVLLYAGDNDLAAGAEPAAVADRFSRFVGRVRAALPDTRIVYISIKPSPARAALLPAIRDTNALIHAIADDDPAVEYVDIFTPMLDAAGQPREDLFGPDRLHMNPRGYALWQDLIAAYVR